MSKKWPGLAHFVFKKVFPYFGLGLVLWMRVQIQCQWPAIYLCSRSAKLYAKVWLQIGGLIYTFKNTNAPIFKQIILDAQARACF